MLKVWIFRVPRRAMVMLVSSERRAGPVVVGGLSLEGVLVGDVDVDVNGWVQRSTQRSEREGWVLMKCW